MNREFNRVNAALASSLAGRAMSQLTDAVKAAWRNASTGARFRSIGSSLGSMPSPALIRTIATAVCIAAALQPPIISAMPATVAPAIPWPAFALLAMFAGIAAWQADAIVTAWPGSFLARWIGR